MNKKFQDAFRLNRKNLELIQKEASLNFADYIYASTDNNTAENLNNFFTSLFTSETSRERDFVKQHESRILYILSFSTAFLWEEFRALDTTNWLLYETLNEIISTLTSIFQSSWEIGKTFEWLQLYEPICHPQKSSKNELKNHRPISFTSMCSNFMEKITGKNTLEFFSSNNIKSRRQYGFRPGRSTTVQLLQLVDDWTEELGNGNGVDIVYIDFQEVFDNVPYKMLLGTIDWCGKQGTALDWIQNFRFAGKQHVVINESTPSGQQMD